MLLSEVFAREKVACKAATVVSAARAQVFVPCASQPTQLANAPAEVLQPFCRPCFPAFYSRTPTRQLLLFLSSAPVPHSLLQHPT